MEKIILIKYGELTTKKENINLFIQTLKENIKYKLKDEPVEIQYDKGRMFIRGLKDNYDKVIAKLKEVFGIHEIVVCYEIKTLDLEEIKKEVLSLVQ